MKMNLPVLITIMLWSATAAAQNDMYHGGYGDGYAGESLIDSNFSDPPMYYAFFGGHGDGYAYGAHAPYSFGDPAMHFAYYGGNGDGYTGDENAPYNFPHPPMYYAYFGGDGDGFAGDTMNLFDPLPVQLLSFTGRAVGDEGWLEWKVALETGIRHYELQRSPDARHYASISKQPATRNGAPEITYSYTDHVPFEGNNYYRLRIVEISGKEQFSPVVLLTFRNGTAALSLYPNPADQSVTVMHDAGREALLRVFDLKGAQVGSMQISKGTGSSTIQLGALPGGVYLLAYEASGGQRQVIRFIKK